MVKTVWAVSLPILFVQISETLLYVTDTAFLARVGATELAALALADTLLQFWTVPVAGLIEAMVILIARRAGQGRHGAVGKTFNRGGTPTPPRARMGLALDSDRLGVCLVLSYAWVRSGFWERR